MLLYDKIIKLLLQHYRGETFQWLASNALGYAAYLAADSEKEPTSASANNLNKMALRNYLKLFPGGVEAVQKKKTEKKPTDKVQGIFFYYILNFAKVLLIASNTLPLYT
jgi:hypothetical protein